MNFQSTRDVNGAKFSAAQVIKQGLAAAFTTIMQLVSCPGASHQDTCGKFRIGVQIQLVLNAVFVFQGKTGAAGADHRAAVGQGRVILF